MAIPCWLRKMSLASHLKFIFCIGMTVTFSLNILFLFENGKPIAANSEWNFHFQTRYPFLECRVVPDVKGLHDHEYEFEYESTSNAFKLKITHFHYSLTVIECPYWALSRSKHEWAQGVSLIFLLINSQNQKTSENMLHIYVWF